MTAAAVLLPWALFVPLGAGSFAEVFAISKLWGALWPVLLGAVLAYALLQARNLPAPPEGDVLVLAERGFSRLTPPVNRFAELLDARLRTWPSGALMLLLTVLVLLGAMAGR